MNFTVTDRGLLIFIATAMAFKMVLLISMEHSLSEQRELILQNRATVVDFLQQTKEREAAAAAALVEQLRIQRKTTKETEAIENELKESKQKIELIEEKLK